MDDRDLSKYLKYEGDRFAVKNFCTRLKASLTQTFALKLKQKLYGMGECNKNVVGKSTSPKNMKPNSTSGKTRRISIGWICNGKIIRPNQGGGVRDIDVSKNYKKTDILKIALDFFFPDGKSTKGCLDQFTHDVYDFKSNPFDEELTVEQIYNITGLTRVRFYLTSTNSVDFNNFQTNRKTEMKSKTLRRNKTDKLKKRIIESDSSDESEFNFAKYISVNEKKTKNGNAGRTTNWNVPQSYERV